MSHYTDYTSYTEALLAFVQEVRGKGFNTGIQSSHDTIIAALEGLWLDKDLFEYALAALYCTSPDERRYFSKIYKRFWREKGTRIKDQSNYKNQKRIKKKTKNVAVMLGQGAANEDSNQEEAKTTSGASTNQSAKQTDFSKLTHTQSEALNVLSEKLVKEMSMRIKRRKKKSKNGTINISKSIRKNLQYGSTIINLATIKPKKDKHRLLILLDVSGSMDKYSFYLLKFLWSLRSHFKHIETFAFSTDMQRITDYISDKDIGIALAMVSHNVTHWSGGTKIGECLRDFNDTYAKHYLNGKTITIILSDGLDTGDINILEDAIKKIKLRSKRLIWLNPLKGMEGYEPIQRGMKAAMPSISHFGSAHNFESLLDLENILIDA